MAAAGLPKSGRIGFEIFDKTNLGMTDFAEHVNYRRALEGELERSVMALNEVEQARVHISFPQESVFQEARQPAKASVLLRLRGGVQLPETAIPAITHLIASAVEGLAPEAVSVLDMRGNLLNRAKQVGDSGSGHFRKQRWSTGTQWNRISPPSWMRRSSPWWARADSAPPYPPTPI